MVLEDSVIILKVIYKVVIQPSTYPTSPAVVLEFLISKMKRWVPQDLCTKVW